VKLACILFLFTSTSPLLFAGTRYAFLIAKNDGGSKKPKLKYAHHDARNLERALFDTAALDSRRSIVLFEPSIDAVRQGLIKFAATVARDKMHAREVFFYYSGHSDESGLNIGNALLPFIEIKQFIESLQAEVKIVILDSCSSGTLARVKGGYKVPSAILTENINHRGTAILASSSASEDSQEADQIKGSYFTHNLVAALRGAADTNHDRRISLTEAYNYAYDETLANTLESRAGPQHPFFDFKVSGQGDFALADLTPAGSELVLEGLQGKIYFIDKNEHVALRMSKTTGTALSMRLPPASWRVRIFHEGKISEARTTLDAGEKKLLRFGDFSPVNAGTLPPPQDRFTSPFFASVTTGPSFHFFMPSGGLLRSSFDLADLGFTARAFLGYKFRDSIPIFITGAISGMKNLTKTADTVPLILNAGVGARYHFYPSGFYVGGSLNAAWNRFVFAHDFGQGRESVSYNTGMGFGVDLNAGIEWQLANGWGLGLSWFSYFGSVYGRASGEARLEASHIQNLVIGLALSVTFF